MVKFKKIFIVLIIFFSLINFKSYAEVVDKVTVKGNERITLETILIFSDINVGKNYEASDINLIIKKLYETNFFSNISAELENGLLTITVKENPIITNVVFDGEKADKYKEVLRSLITLRENTSFLENFVKSDINVVNEFYKTLGFYFVKIDLDIENLKNNRVNLVYTIDKGDKAKISKIYFLGDKKIRDKRLRDIITSQEAKFWKFISRNVYLNKSRVELDKRLLKNYYKNKGYYEVDIASSNVEYSEGEGFVLSYTINAGERYRFKKIFLNVADELDQTAFASLEGDFNKIVGDYYSQKKLTKILEKIDKLSEQKELQFINHGITETLDSNGIEVKINIFEGQKFTIERINITGNNVTNDSVIRSELVVDEGDPYSALLVNKSINRLKARNIFGKVEEKISEGSTPDQKILEISIEEKATGEVSAGAGVGTDGTSLAFAVKENNWLGRGINLKTDIFLTEEKIMGNLSVTNPNYNYTGNAVSAGVDISSTDMTETSGYKSSNTGFSIGTEFEQYRDFFLNPALSLSFEDIEVQDSASAALKKMDGSFTNLDFTYGITADKRNQRFNPTDGYRAKFSQKIPLIIESSDIVNGLDVSKYHTFSDDLIGAIKFYGRTIHGLKGEDVRLTNRLFLPQSKLRGFNTRRVGPKDDEDWIGGNYVTALGFEAQLPNILPESTRTDVAVFLDTGNVWSVDYSDSIDDTNMIRSAVGITANMYTTIGPLSFTVAQDLASSVNDDTQKFNFRLGTSF